MSEKKPKKQILPQELAQAPELYSRHILFFPFQWRFSEVADVRDPFRYIRQAIQTAGHWKAVTSTRQTEYSTFNYLHDYAAEAVFDKGLPGSPVLNFVWNGDSANGLPFSLALRNAAIEKNGGIVKALGVEPFNELESGFHLKFFTARLNVYETGIGILSLFIDNFTYRTKEAVLFINDFIRRLYPPYLNFRDGIESVKNNGALPALIQLGSWKETWESFPGNGQSSVPEYFLPAHLSGLLGPGFIPGNEAGKISVEQVLDDRMFVMSLLLDQTEAGRLSNLPKETKDSGHLHDAFWYAYTFIDPGKPQIANREMMGNLLREAGYPRWTEDGTFYAACRYSFVALSDKPWIVKTPMTNNYTRLVELCLVQRASALRFREEASAISTQIAGGENPAAVAKRIRDLYGAYIRFVNRFHFLEATPVEQGLELYDLLRKQLRVQEQVDRLKDELEELQSYAAMLHEEERGRALNFLTVLGAAFLLPSFFVSYFGLSDNWKRPLEAHPIITAVVFSLSFGLAALLYYGRFFQTRNRWRLAAGIALTILYLALLYALPHLAEWRLL